MASSTENLIKRNKGMSKEEEEEFFGGEDDDSALASSAPRTASALLEPARRFAALGDRVVVHIEHGRITATCAGVTVQGDTPRGRVRRAPARARAARSHAR